MGGIPKIISKSQELKLRHTWGTNYFHVFRTKLFPPYSGKIWRDHICTVRRFSSSYGDGQTMVHDGGFEQNLCWRCGLERQTLKVMKGGFAPFQVL